MNLLTGMLCALCATCGVSAAAQTPNIIFILADDLGYGDLACYGSDKVATPHLDGMAKEGVRLTSFYVAPVCSPTRAALMTGCIPQRVGIGGVLFPRNNHGLNPDEKTLPELLREQGYATAIIGKWHLGNQDLFQPLNHGFDTWYGTPASNSQGFDPNARRYADDCVWREGYTRESIRTLAEARCPLVRDNVVVEVPADQSQLTRRYTREAIRFVTEHKDGPFFLYLPHNMVHIPVHASEDFVGKSQLGIFGDAIEELDWSTGEILKTLQELGIDGRTLVVFTSDNGPHLGQGGSAGPMRGEKGSLFEGGARVPCLVRWPGQIPANRVIAEPVTIMDMLPTLASLAGGTVPGDRVIDGRNAWPIIAGDDGVPALHDAIYYLRGHSVAGIRTGDWKLLLVDAKEDDAVAESALTAEEMKLPRRDRKSLLKARTKAAGGQETVEMLFNLRDDPGETTDLSDERPDIAAGLRKQLAEFRTDLRATQRRAGIAGSPAGTR